MTENLRATTSAAVEQFTFNHPVAHSGNVLCLPLKCADFFRDEKGLKYAAAAANRTIFLPGQPETI